ncbi:MAG: helix-turn-helix transcriptional regulator [Clostridia bacterium]|nr:helix-turn-helix transcriptional regulator [Clostridia bacterium]
MNIRIGEKIKLLRKQNKITQDELANVLGVTAQAISRWENCASDPDIDLIPSIANFFGVSIDELFGYHGEREKKIDNLLNKIELLSSQNAREDINLDECISILRDGLVEFPSNERIMHKLACILNDTGWSRHSQWQDYDDNSYIINCFDKEKSNKYWNEAISLFETLILNTTNNEIKANSIYNLIMLYRNTGEYQKAIDLSNMLPKIRYSREIMLSTATDGKLQAEYLGESILELAYMLSEQIVYGLVNNKSNFITDLPIEKLKGAISLFFLVAEDNNLGIYHRRVCYLYLYLSRLQYEKGYKDEAFISLDKALEQAKKYDEFSKNPSDHYTALLLKNTQCKTEAFSESGSLANNLPNDWPMWTNPDYSKVKSEILKEPKWKIWEGNCKK